MMNYTMDLLSFLLKATVVLYGIYYILEKLWGLYSEHNEKVERYRAVQSLDPSILKLKIQAYERLSLMVDRWQIGKVIQRVTVPNMEAEDLKAALYIAVQQEYDHNATQQVYVSDQLWEIVRTVKDTQLTRIAAGTQELATGASADELTDLLYADNSEKNVLDMARKAIATEAKTILT